MSEKLNDAGDSVGAVDGAFGAANDLNFVDVVESEARKIDGSAGGVDGRAVDEDFREIGVAAVEEDGGGATFGSGAANSDAWGKGEGIGEGHGLALFDLFPGDDLDRRCGLVD